MLKEFGKPTMYDNEVEETCMYEVTINDQLRTDIIHISNQWYDSITFNKYYIYMLYLMNKNVYKKIKH